MTAEGDAPPPDATGILRTLRESPRAVHLVLAGVALNRAGSFVQLFLVLYLVHLGDGVEHAGLALTVYGAGGVAGVAVAGILLSRLGERATIVASMVAAGGCLVAMAVVTRFWALVWLAGLAGLAAQCYRPAAATLLADVTPPGRLVMISAAYRLALNVGAALAPLAGAAIIAATSYRWLFVVNSAAALAFAAIAGWVLRGRHRTPPERRGAGGYGAVARDERFVGFLLALFLISLVDVQYLSALPLTVASHGLSTAFYAGLVAVNALVVILVELPVTRFVQLWPLRRGIALGILVIGLGVGGFGVPGGPAVLILAVLVWSLGETVGAPSTAAYPGIVAPPEQRPPYVAATVAAQSLGYAVGPALGTLVWTHSRPTLFAGCAVVGVAAALVARTVVAPGRGAELSANAS